MSATRAGLKRTAQAREFEIAAAGIRFARTGHFRGRDFAATSGKFRVDLGRHANGVARLHVGVTAPAPILMVLLALRPNYDSVSFLHDRERRGSEIFFFECFVGAIYFSVNVYRDLIFRAVRYVDRPEVDIHDELRASPGVAG